MLINREGQRIPQTVFHALRGTEWVNLDSKSLFADRVVIVFALPGAFTPTCTTTHAPRYDRLQPIFKKHGVDEIICVSVNDPYVMSEWQESQNARNITFMPDGNGEFTKAMGMLVDKTAQGLGRRSWRYSMLVKDGVIEKMFIEPQIPGDPLQVSDADTMLAYIAPNAEKPMEVTVFSRKGCPFCARATAMLRDADIDFEELIMNRDYTDQTLRAVVGTVIVPWVFVNGESVGGSEAVTAWLKFRKAA